VRQLVYQFGYNTKVASQGNGTGTTTVKIMGPAKDGGLIVSAQDFWWNTARPRAWNTCEVYSGGSVSCSQPPYAISPIQLTLFPLLAKHYFDRLSSAVSSAKHTFTVKAAVLPGGASGFASSPYTWNCSFSLHENGPIPNGGGTMLVVTQGNIDQQGGRYWKLTSKQRIAYDPAAKLPTVVSDVRTHIPMRSVYSNDLVELKLIKDSQSTH
jgi:hypothetical protein